MHAPHYLSGLAADRLITQSMRYSADSLSDHSSATGASENSEPFAVDRLEVRRLKRDDLGVRSPGERDHGREFPLRTPVRSKEMLRQHDDQLIRFVDLQLQNE